jgi:hypothetical protein
VHPLAVQIFLFRIDDFYFALSVESVVEKYPVEGAERPCEDVSYIMVGKVNDKVLRFKIIGSWSEK